MPEIRRSATVPCTTQEMYDIVDDVESYPEFVDWCGDAAEESRDDDFLEASLDLRRGGAQGWFRIRLHLDPVSSVRLEVLDGPIRDLSGLWLFQDAPGGRCRLTLDVEYGSRMGLMSMMMAPLVAEIADGLLDAFRRRAVRLYGSG